MPDVDVMPSPSCPSEPEEDEIVVEPLCTICNVDATVIECSGNISHGFCRDCFQGYARASFELNAEYERERERGGLVSPSGSLPCPHFIQGACTCIAIHPSLLRRFVSDDTFEMWRHADVRLGMAVLAQEQEQAEVLREMADEQRTALGNLRHAVIEALTRGGTVCCPQCNAKGDKDDQCMHIKCDSCNTEWCYCCGRPRGSNGTREMCSRSNGCDSVAAFLESQQGWSQFAMRNETPGEGALHEFHRRRIAYFLKQLKQSTESELWAELRSNYPDILNDVPTVGRRIDWDAIDRAEIPTFGETRPVDVRWAEEGREIIDDLAARRRDALERQDEIELQSNRKTILQRRFAQYLSSEVPRSRWIFVTVHFLVVFGLLCSSITIENEILKGSFGASLCIYVSLLCTRAVSLAIDGRYSVLLSHEDEWVLPYAEVQFCGSRVELPYLSAAGRWHRIRMLYLFLLFSCLAFGTAMTFFFRRWSSARCISCYGLCGLGPALLAFSGMLFGGGSILVNCSPPPATTAYRYPTFRSTMWRLFVLGAVLVPVGVYLMVGYTGDSPQQPLWIVGCIVTGISTAVILGALSSRCLNPRGFALDRGELLSNKTHVLFWTLVVLGVFMLGTSELGNARFVVGCALILSPILFVLLAKVHNSS